MTNSSCARFIGTDLLGFVTAAEVAYPRPMCLSLSGEHLTAHSRVRITKPAALNFEGATVTGTSSLVGAMLGVGPHAAQTSIRHVTLDQGSGTSNGINCNAACTVTSATVEGMRGNGIFVSGRQSDGSVIGGTSAATGVTTEGSHQSGLMFNHDANVTVGYVTSSYDSHNGVFFDSVSAPCSARSITAGHLGRPDAPFGLSTDDEGAGLELIGTNGCSFENVTDSGNGGYGINLTHDSWNTFDTVSVTGEAKGELNAGINIDTHSAHNTFSTATIDHEATGVDIGDNGVPGGRGEAGNDDNAFGTLNVSGDSYGSISIVGGEDNTFTKIVGTHEGNDADGQKFYLGLIQFQYQARTRTCKRDTEPCPVSGNVVTSATFTGPPASSWDTARYVVYADAGASGNSVAFSAVPHASTYSVAPCDDVDARNTFRGC